MNYNTKNDFCKLAGRNFAW